MQVGYSLEIAGESEMRDVVIGQHGAIHAELTADGHVGIAARQAMTHEEERLARAWHLGTDDIPNRDGRQTEKQAGQQACRCGEREKGIVTGRKVILLPSSLAWSRPRILTGTITRNNFPVVAFRCSSAYLRTAEVMTLRNTSFTVAP